MPLGDDQPMHRLIILANIDIATNDSGLQLRIVATPSFEYIMSEGVEERTTAAPVAMTPIEHQATMVPPAKPDTGERRRASDFGNAPQGRIGNI